MKTLPLTSIRCDSGTQSRIAINDETVADYANGMASGDKFPPLDVFFDGSEYHLADGFHRYMAASRNSLKEIAVTIHSGTATDALWFSIGANRTNGQHMSASDKRYAIQLALAKFPEKTQEAIAKHVGCTQARVSQVANELINVYKLKVPAKRKGKDGKERKTTYKKKPVKQADADAWPEKNAEDKIQHDPPEGVSETSLRADVCSAVTKLVVRWGDENKPKVIKIILELLQ